jgi:endonuclease YncB( thermonuclease family)
VRPPSYTSRRTLLNRFVGFATWGLATGGLGSVLPSRGVSADWSLPEPVQAAGALNGDTLRLASGDEVRLIGIEAPKPALAPRDPAMLSLAASSTAALEALAQDGVILRYDVLRQDRYRRRLAQVFAPDGTWLQARQVAAGLARVHGDGSNRGGLAELLIGEDAARAEKRGLWRHRAFAVRRADDPGLKRLAGSFQIVRGRVESAAVARDNGYVNFGADRRTDFTLVLRKPVLAMLDPAVVDLTRLSGRSIRCRGWIDLHDGPSMDLACPEQIEVLEA